MPSGWTWTTKVKRFTTSPLPLLALLLRRGGPFLGLLALLLRRRGGGVGRTWRAEEREREKHPCPYESRSISRRRSYARALIKRSSRLEDLLRGPPPRGSSPGAGSSRPPARHPGPRRVPAG